MSDVAKWVLLVAGFVVIIGMIIVLDPFQYIDHGVLGQAIDTLIDLAGDGFMFGRGLVNNLLSPWARAALSGLLFWIIGKEFITWTIKITTWAYHYLFK